MNPILAKAREHFSKKLPFVMYCKPNADKVIGLFQKTCELFPLSIESSGFAFVSFDHKLRYMIPESESDIYFQKVSEKDFFLSKEVKEDLSGSGKLDFEMLVESAIAEIAAGTFEKVVLSRKEQVASVDFQFDQLFTKITAAYPTAFRYVFYHPEIGFWMGASPEQLMKVENNLLQTVSLAGTQLYDSDNTCLWGDKEKKEQQIVTDYIVGCLESFSEQIHVSEPATYVAGKLAHIKTDISAHIEPKKIEQMIAVLHPTPAVCGFPKEKALQFIVEKEGYDRSFYAGFLGEWNKNFTTYQGNQFDLYVNLRCMNYQNKELNVYVGCGITRQSIPELEYQETANKAMTMKQII